MIRDDDVTITVCPDGPLLVRGPASLQDADGQPVDHDRNVIALCRCGRSQVKPLCDGSHRKARFRAASDASAMTEIMTTARPAQQR